MNGKSSPQSLVKLIVSMLIFGTVGVFSKYIPLPSESVALARAVIGTAFLLPLMLIMRKKADISAIRKNALPLIASGICLGLNWMLFFASCRETTVATATLSYYLAPTFVIIAARFVFRERLTVKRIVCVAMSLIGMVFVSGVIGGGSEGVTLHGILLGIGAAVLYAAVVILNKLMKDIGAYDKTVVQFMISAVVLTPFAFTEGIDPSVAFRIDSLIFILIIGVLHTGIAYALYFGASSELRAHTVAIYSYIDPIIAIILSALLPGEPIDVYVIIGAVLILSASLISEINLPQARIIKGRKNNEN